MLYDIHNLRWDEKLLELAAHAEYASSHPISKSLCAAYGKPIQSSRVTDLQLLSGISRRFRNADLINELIDSVDNTVRVLELVTAEEA